MEWERVYKMKKKITEEQLNALTEAVRKELKENDSNVLYFDEYDYFWPRDQNGDDIEAKDFADDLGIKLGLFTRVNRSGELEIYQKHSRITYLIQNGIITFGFISILVQLSFVAIVNIFDPSHFLRSVIAAFMEIVSIKILMTIKKRGKLSTFDEIGLL